MTEQMVVLSTAGSEEEASRLARLLVEDRLAACVAVTPGVKSVYRWGGRMEESQEWALTIKTSRALLPALMARLKSAHSYQVPEILALTVEDGNPDYLDWMKMELKQE